MYETRQKALGGSATAENMEDMFDAGTLEAALTRNWYQQIARALASAATGENEAMRQKIARALLSRDPEAALAEVSKQARSDRTKRLIAEALFRNSGQQAAAPVLESSGFR